MRGIAENEPTDSTVMGGQETAQLDLSVIIVSYNTGPGIAESLRQINDAIGHLAAEIIVVDNDSKDDTVEVARRSIERGRVIDSGDNLGFGGGVNLGLEVARGRHTLIMNDDAVTDRASLDMLRDVLDGSPDIAMAGPAITNEAGERMPSWRPVYPGPREELRRLAQFLRGDRGPKTSAVDGPHEVAWLVAACVLVDTEVLRRHGGFNPEFFFYGEDIDLGRRLHSLGYRCVTVPGAKSVHVGGVATATAFVNRDRDLQQARSRSVYYRIWYPRALRTLIYVSRAIGFRNQPWRLRTYGSLALHDGPSLRSSRYPKPIPSPAPDV